MEPEPGPEPERAPPPRLAAVAGVRGCDRAAPRPTETALTASDGGRTTISGAGAGDTAVISSVAAHMAPTYLKEYLEARSCAQADTRPSERFEAGSDEAMAHLDEHGYVVIRDALDAAGVARAPSPPPTSSTPPQ